MREFDNRFTRLVLAHCLMASFSLPFACSADDDARGGRDAGGAEGEPAAGAGGAAQGGDGSVSTAGNGEAGEGGRAGGAGDAAIAGAGGEGDRGGTAGADAVGGAGGEGGGARQLGRDARQLISGHAHNCVLLPAGSVRCWGLGAEGQLGYGNLENIGDNELPHTAGDVDVGGVVQQITAGRAHTCALLSNGKVRCWGAGLLGALGYGDLENVGDDETPASAGDVDVGGSVVQISAGSNYTCAVLEGGGVRCWGDNAYGQLGYATTEPLGDDETPAELGDIDLGGPAVGVAAGTTHTCALLQGGTVRCWGHNGAGQLGYVNTTAIGDTEHPATAGDVDVGGSVIDVSTGEGQSCALLQNGQARCWGYNDHGELGYGNLDWIGDTETPASAGNISVGGEVRQIVAGFYYSCAVLVDGALRCWGRNYLGVLGYGPESETLGDDELPSDVDAVQVGGAVTAVATGGGHACALLSNGAVRCWGSGASGERGYGKTNASAAGEKPADAGDVLF